METTVRSQPVTELLGITSHREPVQPADGKSQSRFERLTVNGERYFLKQLSPATDWVMRATGDHVHRPFLIWEAGLMDRVPRCIDHTVIGMQICGAGDDAELSILMRDVAPCLVAEGNALLPEAQHARFIDHLAELSVTFWDWHDTIGGLTTIAERVRHFDAANVARELAVAEPPDVIVAAEKGWRSLIERAPVLADIARAVQEDPAILTVPLAATPVTWRCAGVRLQQHESQRDPRPRRHDCA